MDINENQEQAQVQQTTNGQTAANQYYSQPSNQYYSQPSNQYYSQQDISQIDSYTQAEYDYYSELVNQEEFKNSVAAKYTNTQELIKAHNNLASLIGGKIENAGPEIQETLVNTLGDKIIGIPQDPSEYKITNSRIIDMMQDDNNKKELAELYSNELYAAGIGTKQAPAIINWLEDVVQGYETERSLEIDTVNASDHKLAAEFFGPNIEYIADTCTSYINKHAKEDFGIDAKQFTDHAEAKGYICDPIFLALLTHLAESKMGENFSSMKTVHTHQYALGNGGDNKFTSSDARKILANPRHPEHLNLIKQMKEYYSNN